jgi:lipoyl-dependent peroxiredoxin
MKTLHTAHAKSQGGRNGRSQTTDGKLSFELSMPGGPKKMATTTNPEELFACGYAACFGSALEYVAGQQKQNIAGAEVQAEVSLNQGDDGFSIAVALNVTIPNMDAQAARKLVEAAHQVCPYSKATRNNIKVELSANNSPLAQAA